MTEIDPAIKFVDYVLSIVGPHDVEAVWTFLTEEDSLVPQLEKLVGTDVHMSSQGSNLDDNETYFSLRAKHVRAIKLVEYALHLRMYGERAPGGEETWREFDQQAELFLRQLPNTIEGVREHQVQTLVELQERAEFYKRAAVKLNAEIEDTLAPALGFEPYPPGSPGYSEDQVNYITGDHTAESLAFHAAHHLLEQDATLGEIRHLMGHFEADAVGRREFIERMSVLLRGE